MQKLLLYALLIALLSGCTNKAYIESVGGYGKQLVDYAHTTEQLIDNINTARADNERKGLYIQWLSSGDFKCYSDSCITPLTYKDAKMLSDTLALYGQKLVDLNNGRDNTAKGYTDDLAEALSELRDVSNLKDLLLSYDPENGQASYDGLVEKLSNENISKLSTAAIGVARWRYDYVAAGEIEDILEESDQLVKGLTEALVVVNKELINDLIRAIKASDTTEKSLTKALNRCATDMNCPGYPAITLASGGSLVYGDNLKTYLDQQITLKDGVSAVESIKNKYSSNSSIVKKLLYTHYLLAKGPQKICSRGSQDGCVSAKAAYKQAEAEVKELKELQEVIEKGLKKGNDK